MAQSSIGTKVEVEKDNNWVEITDIQSIPEVGGDAQEIDTTNLTNTETSSVPGVKQTSALAIVAFFNNSNEKDNYRILRKLEVAKSYNNYRITYPDGTKIIMNAKVTTKMGAVSVNSAITFTFSLFKKGDYIISDPDGSPITITEIPNTSVTVDGTTTVTPVTDPTGCKISAVSSSPEDVEVNVSEEGVITITGKSAGASTVTVTANKTGHSTGKTSFTVIVE